MPGRSTLPDTQNSLGPVDVAVPIAAYAGGAHGQDRQHVDQGLDVVLDRRLAEQALLHGERRLGARLAPVALDGVEEGGLLAADVRARAAPDLDVEGVALAEDVVAEQAAGAGLGDGVLQALQGARVLAAQVEVAAVGAGRVRRRSSSPRSARTGRPP